MVVSLGRGALLSKVDIESAYRLILVHPEDRPLQAISWVYIDPMLPFSLWSGQTFLMPWWMALTGV